MKSRNLQSFSVAVGAAALAAAGAVQTGDPAPPAPPWFTWATVVNNNDLMPASTKNFNSYNQPSVNAYGLVVIRARSRGGEGGGGGSAGGGGGGGENQPVHGIYTRDMSVAGSPIIKILDRKTEVPQPNNAHYPPSNPLLTTFIETPSFPRIDMGSDTIATRGNHQPVWVYALPDGSETRAGSTGIYTNPFGDLITGASKLGAVPGFGFFAVPGLYPPTMFDVFPGAPAVTGGRTIVFKGNYTVGGIGRTGVFFRDLVEEDISGGPGGGFDPVILIANNTDSFIPGTSTKFGSTSPPSAANARVVFAGFDNEERPTLGGIYLAPLAETPLLKTLVGIGQRVPGENSRAAFNNLGEGGAFDGRYVGFWGAWGTETRTVRLYCPTEGNKDRIAYCNQNLVCEDGTIEKDPNSVCDPTGCWQDKQVPVHQGIFAHDTEDGTTRTVAKTGARFGEFVFWNYSGRTPCVGAGGHGEEGAEDDGEAARWRSSAFVAVSGLRTAFKAVAVKDQQAGCGTCHGSSGTGSANGAPFHVRVVGIYLSRQPGQDAFTVASTGMVGTLIDPEAVYDDDGDPATPPVALPVTELGLEREGLRGDWLAINAKMGIEGLSEEAGMAGIYITKVPSR
jgi:hypothetical protein